MSGPDPGNYRPVSILSITSKVLEKVFMNSYINVLLIPVSCTNSKSGFRKSHSTDSCLQYLTDFIRDEIDVGKLCGMILIDLQRAFDTVDHSILYRKLLALGMSPPALRWFVSYQSYRS